MFPKLSMDTIRKIVLGFIIGVLLFISEKFWGFVSVMLPRAILWFKKLVANIIFSTSTINLILYIVIPIIIFALYFWISSKRGWKIYLLVSILFFIHISSIGVILSVYRKDPRVTFIFVNTDEENKPQNSELYKAAFNLAKSDIEEERLIYLSYKELPITKEGGEIRVDVPMAFLAPRRTKVILFNVFDLSVCEKVVKKFENVRHAFSLYGDCVVGANDENGDRIRHIRVSPDNQATLVAKYLESPEHRKGALIIWDSSDPNSIGLKNSYEEFLSPYGIRRDFLEFISDQETMSDNIQSKINNFDATILCLNLVRVNELFEILINLNINKPLILPSICLNNEYRERYKDVNFPIAVIDPLEADDEWRSRMKNEYGSFYGGDIIAYFTYISTLLSAFEKIPSSISIHALEKEFLINLTTTQNKINIEGKRVAFFTKGS